MNRHVLLIEDDLVMAKGIEQSIIHSTSNNLVTTITTLQQAKSIPSFETFHHIICTLSLYHCSHYSILKFLHAIKQTYPTIIVTLMHKENETALLNAVASVARIDFLVDKRDAASYEQILSSGSVPVYTCKRDIERAHFILGLDDSRSQTLAELARYTSQKAIALDANITNAAISKRISGLVKSAQFPLAKLLLWFRE